MNHGITRRTFFQLAALGAVGAAGLAGCTTSTSSSSASSSAGSASSASVASGSGSASSASAASVRTVVDQAGETIEITGPIESYAVLTTGQMNVCALLDLHLEHLVGAAAGGVTLSATYHHFFPDLETHAKYYDKGSVTAEEILETGCQVMFWSSAKHEELIKALKSAGIICVNVKRNDLDSLKQVINLTADVLDTEYARTQAASYIKYLDDTVASTIALAKSNPVGKTAIILGSPEGMEVKASSEFAVKALEDFGLEYLDGGDNRQGSAALTLEELYELDPDYVVFEFGKDLDKLLAETPAWAEVRALKEGHCYNCPMCLDEWLMPGIENAPLYIWGSSHFLGTPSEEEFKASMKKFYHDYVGYDMDDEEVNAIASGDASYYL